MKTFLSTMSILLLTLTSILTTSTISYGSNGSIPLSGALIMPNDPMPLSPEWNVLDIKGSFIGEYKAEILVYHYVDSTERWVNDYSIEQKKDYSIRLNPEVDYQVWFLSPEGGTKILCIESGTFGTYSISCDIDFSLPGKLFSKLYQDDEGCGYLMDTCKGCFITYDTHPIDNVEANIVGHDQ